MKNAILLSCLLLFTGVSFSQGVSVNETGNPADPTAMLDISSHTKGVLVTRLRTIERTAIQNPVEGLFTYDIDTHSFWVYTIGDWKELLKSGDPIMPGGPASGDLSGSYPSPTVSKIQNLDVVFGVPFDHQVLKWDALSNNWKGRNDSLFLPYNVAFGNATKLFGIQNNNTTSGSSAICGKSGSVGSGVIPAATMGVWGDNSNGMGVVGTSNTGIGTYGWSLGNHGVFGYSTLAGYAGVKGSHANAGGIGVLGEVQTSGIGILGLSFGDSGKAGSFQSSSPSNVDTTLTVSTQGLGILSRFNISNATNNKPAIDIYHNGTGTGLKVRLNQANSSANGVDAIIQGTGIAVYGKSELGVPGKFEITNAANSYPALMVGTNGLGTSLYVSSGNTGVTGSVVDILGQGYGTGLSVMTNYGKAGVFSVTNPAAFNETLNVSTSGNSKNAIFKSNNTGSFETNVFVEQNGNGRGIEVNLTKAANTFAGITVNTAGNKGVEVISAGLFGVTASATANGSVAINGNTGQTADNAIAIRGATGVNVNSCIGVLGESGVNDPTGIGVKGISSSTGTDKGAVTGINNSTGIGVYGEAAGTDGVGIYGLAGSNSSNSKAAVFKNVNPNNIRTVVEVSGNGNGHNMFVNNTNGANSSALVRLRNHGTGNFLALEDGGASSVATIAKNGNIVTDGTLKVKGDKGIVRNSTGTQLRTEIILASMSLPGGGETFSSLESKTININFGTAFSSAPAVYVANVVTDGGTASFMMTLMTNVTTTGCDLIIRNTTNGDIYLGNSSWKIIAIGAE